MWIPYLGSGPYCYANSLAMALGSHGPPPSAVEVLTGSPFGFHLADGLASCGGTGHDAVVRLWAASGPVLGVTDGVVEFHDLRAHLVHFAVRVGARRLADAPTWLARIGLRDAASVAERQARLVGGLQYPLVHHDRGRAADLLMQLAPTYTELDAALAGAGVGKG